MASCRKAFDTRQNVRASSYGLGLENLGVVANRMISRASSVDNRWNGKGVSPNDSCFLRDTRGGTISGLGVKQEFCGALGVRLAGYYKLPETKAVAWKKPPPHLLLCTPYCKFKCHKLHFYCQSRSENRHNRPRALCSGQQLFVDEFGTAVISVRIWECSVEWTTGVFASVVLCSLCCCCRASLRSCYNARDN